MKIGIDIMGGDFAPRMTTLGAILAQKALPREVGLVLFGDQDEIIPLLKEAGENPGDYEIVHCSEVIAMGEHPAKAFAQKTDSSLVKGFGYLKAGAIDAFSSAGNTGAMMAGAMMAIKPIPGIIRPTISAVFPTLQGGGCILLDVGLNADVKPEVLYQYGILGSLYAEKVFNISKPRVALLNIGSEAEKGNIFTKNCHELLKDSKDFNFTGNIEPNELLFGHADVVVTDGFTGNIVLKQTEGFYKALRMRKIQDDYFDRFNYENYGGTPILGINAAVCIGHGISNDIAIKNMILHSHDIAKSSLSTIISETLALTTGNTEV
jgi:phosphate acyltransferase